MTTLHASIVPEGHYSFIPTGGSGSLSLLRMPPGERLPGKLFFPDGRVADWNWYGVVESEGRLCVKGDPLFLAGAVEDLLSPNRPLLPVSEAQEYARLMFLGFSQAAADNGICTPSDLHGFYFSLDGDRPAALLVLPPVLRNLLASNSGTEETALPPVRFSIPKTFPDSAAWSVLFASAACLYRRLTGGNPFPEQPLTSPYERARLCGPVVPAATEEASPETIGLFALLDRVLSLPSALEKRGPYPLSEVKHSLSGYRDFVESGKPPSSPPLPAVPEDKRSAPLERRLFLRRNRKKIRLAAVAVAVIALALSFTFNLVFRTYATDGLNAEQVIDLFYESRNRLDHESLDACLAGSAGSGLINEVTNLYVISRVRLGYERTEALIPADVWFASDAPEVGEEKMVYGTAGVVKRRERSNESSALYRTRYLTVYPKNPEDITDEFSSTYEIRLVEEALRLEFDGKRWAISEITPIASAAVDTQEALDYLGALQSAD